MMSTEPTATPFTAGRRQGVQLDPEVCMGNPTYVFQTAVTFLCGYIEETYGIEAFPAITRKDELVVAPREGSRFTRQHEEAIRSFLAGFADAMDERIDPTDVRSARPVRSSKTLERLGLTKTPWAAQQPPDTDFIPY